MADDDFVWNERLNKWVDSRMHVTVFIHPETYNLMAVLSEQSSKRNRFVEELVWAVKDMPELLQRVRELSTKPYKHG